PDMKRAFVATVALGLRFGLGLLLGTYKGQDYPNKPIRIFAPAAPGGSGDLLALNIAARTDRRYAQYLLPEHDPGDSGHVGSQFAAKSPGDGYTLMVGTIGIHAAYASYSRLTYKPAEELRPIMIVGEAPNVVLVPVNSPFKTFQEFLAHTKANPGKVNYA